ncbi:hypothetical protein BGI07_00525 [Snodgrassella alvi]|uniref:autotransporter outer membrane beta-barrel domain-containing protein n=1 Tax=Snodgrassella alvi TaxID=1196083 RepID=UPI0009FF82D3|nr:autotransporter outer membrane beta-barrel domain-containing protein [Snodgrassella alvi]ORF28151.1 hypothetical protein BGI07_00525 [Snodgrassella alvi]ORF34617.1 hypothetical protein BGI11_04545 [Snodgrassella alvi]
MNNIYKSKWSEATQTWVACSELVRGKTKNNCAKIAAAVAFAVTSISSYAAGCNVIGVTGDTNPNIVQTAANGECKLDPSNGTQYNKISVSDTKLTGDKIVATGPESGVNQKTIILNNATVEANTLETTNRRLKYTSNALASSNSKVTTSGDLTAHNSGNNAIIISSQDGSEFNIGGNLNIDDNGSMIAIDNSESIINVAGDITIKGKDTSVNNRNSAISNQGGTITAQNINIEQGKGNTVISQTSGSNPDEPGLINIKEDLTIKTEASGPGSSAIEINGGTIKIGGNTDITMTTESDPKVKSSAIIVENGTYDTQGDTAIHINKDGTTEPDTETTGVLMSDNSEFSTNGKLEVNDGQNTVITTTDSLTEQATFNNNKNATTSSSVDTIVHQGSGTLNIKNDGTLISTAASSPNKTDKSVIRNKAKGSIDVNNEATGKIFGNINNDSSGEINITNDGLINNGSINNNDAGIITLNNNNSGKIASDILNGGIGTITVNNKDSASTIAGNITNTKDGNIAINNSGKTDPSKKITNSNAGKIDIINTESGNFESAIDNDATSTGMITLGNKGTVNSTITNKNTGAIKITNDNTLDGSVTNTGNKGTADNIWIDNNKDLKSTINNDGSGTIVVNNNEASSVINGDITNTKDGTITVNNKDSASTIAGNITNTKDGNIAINNSGKTDPSKKITNSNAGKIDIINTESGNFESAIDNDATSTGMITLGNKGTVNSTITNKNTGAIKITNDNTLDGSVTNTGDKGTADNIWIDNNKDLKSTINNDGSGTIVVNNNEASSVINGDITNTKDGTITVNNKDSASTITGNINNQNAGTITLDNNGKIASNILNGGAGAIEINNNNTFSGSIKNTGDKGTIVVNNNSSMVTDITNTNSGSISATNTGTFTGVTTNSGSGTLDLDNQGIWNNTGNSVLTKLNNTTGTIIFPQVSEVNAGDKDQYHTITVNGNYTGGGLMRVNTVWNKDGTSYSDRIDIHGDVDGAPTTVRTLNEKGIYGDVTLKEIPIHSAVVVHVAGKSSGNDFTGSAPTTNAGEAQLKKIDTTSGTDYAWTLTAQPKTPDPVVPVPPGPTVSDKPVLPAPPIKEVPIYAEPVSGYVQMPTADMELGFTTVGTLHERRGENQTYNITGSNNTALGDDQQQTWGRVLVKHLDKDGKKRLDTAGNQSVLQIGHDFILDENEKTGIRRHIGGYVAYGHNENDFRDEYRAKNGYIVDDHYTGKGRTDAVSVGGYGTFYGNNGGYVDLVGQVTYLRNKYNARSNESVHQNGWGAALSAETGKSFIVYGNNWFVEPQAQLVYQYLSLDDFNDRIRHVDQHDPSALRGRVGMRFGYNGDTRDNLPSSSFYGIANIWHDFVNPKSVDIGRDSLKEEYTKTWGELGLGIQLPITRQSDFYSDIRYEKNFGSDKRKGFKGTMGYKYTWL